MRRRTLSPLVTAFESCGDGQAVHRSSHKVRAWVLFIPFWLIDLSAPQRRGPARLAKLLIDTECRRTTASGILFRTVPSYATLEDTQLLVERENSLPGAVLARFSTTRWSGVFLARIADGGRLGL
jgi:hypothetical protein